MNKLFPPLLYVCIVGTVFLSCTPEVDEPIPVIDETITAIFRMEATFSGDLDSVHVFFQNTQSSPFYFMPEFTTLSGIQVTHYMAGSEQSVFISDSTYYSQSTIALEELSTHLTYITKLDVKGDVPHCFAAKIKIFVNDSLAANVAYDTCATYLLGPGDYRLGTIRAKDYINN